MLRLFDEGGERFDERDAGGDERGQLASGHRAFHGGIRVREIELEVERGCRQIWASAARLASVSLISVRKTPVERICARARRALSALTVPLVALPAWFTPL